MTYTTQYNITISKLIGRLLPWYARGRRLFYLLCGSLNPLKTVHDSFIAWAQKKHFEARLTFQVRSLEWYLNRELKDYFSNPDDSFDVDLFAHKNYGLNVEAFSVTNGEDYTDYSSKIATPSSSVVIGTDTLTFTFEDTEYNAAAFNDLEADVLCSDGTHSSASETISDLSVTFDSYDMENCIGKTAVGLYISEATSAYDKAIYLQGCQPSPSVYLYGESKKSGNDVYSYYREEVTGSTTNHFNISAPNLSDSNKKEEYISAIKSIISKYSLIRKYDIIIQDL